MTTHIDSDTIVALRTLHRQHEASLAATYRRRMREGIDVGDIARDPETLYHLETTEALGGYLDALVD